MHFSVLPRHATKVKTRTFDCWRYMIECRRLLMHWKAMSFLSTTLTRLITVKVNKITAFVMIQIYFSQWIGAKMRMIPKRYRLRKWFTGWTVSITITSFLAILIRYSLSGAVTRIRGAIIMRATLITKLAAKSTRVASTTTKIFTLLNDRARWTAIRWAAISIAKMTCSSMM